MKKSEDLLVKFLIALAGLTIGVVVVLTIIAFQIGVDELEKPNRIAIISGLLSMVGGIAGAFGAYFIAKWQMTNLLDLQFKREHEKMILEIKINKFQEIIYFLNHIKKEFNLFERTFHSHVAYTQHLLNESQDVEGFMKMYSLKQCDKVEESLNKLSKDYVEIFKYKVFLDSDIMSQTYIFRDGLELFTVPLSNYLYFLFIEDGDSKEEVRTKWIKETEKMEWEVLAFEAKIKIQIVSLETQLNKLII